MTHDEIKDILTSRFQPIIDRYDRAYATEFANPDFSNDAIDAIVMERDTAICLQFSSLPHDVQLIIYLKCGFQRIVEPLLEPWQRSAITLEQDVLVRR